MNKEKRNSMDGFVPRRRSSGAIGQHHGAKASADTVRPKLRSMQEGDTGIEKRPTRSTLGHADIRASLRQIDASDESPKGGKRKERRNRKGKLKKPMTRKRRIIKWSIIGILVILLAIAGYVGFKFLSNLGNVVDGNIFGLVRNEPLKQDANGRSNFVIYGTAEDSDEDGGHDGANLTDSIMILSINQTTKDAYMLSVPRDLWVDFGRPCNAGYQGKINEVYECNSNGGQDEKAGAAAIQSKIKEVFGLDIQYYVHLNLTVVTEAVDAVDGVTVTIESEDPRGILDRNFDWRCGYQCYYVNYKQGEVVHLDGEHALALARARNASGGYGLPNANFDREKNQQKILRALQEKALSAGTLTSISKVTELMDAFGNNLRTNVETKELRTLMGLANDIRGDKIRSLSLIEAGNMMVVTDTSPIGSSIVRPAAGLYDYSQLQAFVQKESSSNPVEREAAPIVVLNGTDTVGVARTEATSLESKGFTVSIFDDAPAGTYEPVEIYKIGEGNTATADALKKYYGIETVRTTTPPVAVSNGTAFVVVIGQVRGTQTQQ